MIQHEFEELLEQFSQDELNEKSTVKGQFTSYITRRMEWHAIRYAAKNRPNVIVISLDQAPRHLTDIDAEQMFRKVEIELALQQEVQRLSPKEKEWLLCFLKMNYKENPIATTLACMALGLVIGSVIGGDLWINYDQDNRFTLEDITHWQPLPEPPEN